MVWICLYVDGAVNVNVNVEVDVSVDVTRGKII